MSQSRRMRRVAVLSVGTIAAMSACFGGGGGGGEGEAGAGAGESSSTGNFITSSGSGTPSAEEVLNDTIILPPGSYQVDPDVAGTDTSVNVTNPSGSTMDLNAGDTVTVNTGFDAPNGNVVGAGIRFGSTGPAWVVPIDATGNTSGQLSFQMSVPPEICNMLSQICHDIKCYEFAVTDAGTFSQANIMDLALACNNCDEPSCQDLLQSCMGMQCDDTTQAGDDLPYTGQVELGQSQGTFDVFYDMQTVMDQIIVSYEGSVLFDSGCVSGSATVPITYSGTATSVQVQVNPNCDGGSSGTAWSFSVSCPL